MQYTLKELKSRLYELPEDVQDAIFSVETADAIANLQEKYRLHVDQAGKLAEEIGLVMLGLTRPYDFVTRIATQLRITQTVASQITQDINNQIFNPIKESLKQIHELHATETHNAPKTKPSDTETMFDAKLKTLFTTTAGPAAENGKPTSSDPYREAVE